MVQVNTCGRHRKTTPWLYLASSCPSTLLGIVEHRCPSYPRLLTGLPFPRRWLARAVPEVGGRRGPRPRGAPAGRAQAGGGSPIHPWIARLAPWRPLIAISLFPVPCSQWRVQLVATAEMNAATPSRCRACTSRHFCECLACKMSSVEHLMPVTILPEWPRRPGFW